jgi:hypothetical protein
MALWHMPGRAKDEVQAMQGRIHRLASIATLALGALALGGCASMGKDECLAVDWRTIGYEDGVRGYTGERITQHRKACAKHGVAPDLDLYQAGRREGLYEYCQPANGFRVGARGGGYGGVCPAELEAEFVGAYESGFQLHTLQSRVASTNSLLAAKRRELNAAEDELVRLSLVIIGNDATPEERAAALVDTRQLAESKGRLQTEIEQLEQDRLRFEQELEDYRATLAYGR